MKLVNQIAFWLMAFGGINYGLVGFFNFDVVTKLFSSGSVTRIVYCAIGVGTVWTLVSTFGVLSGKGKRR